MVRKPNLGTQVGTQSKDFGVISAMMKATQAISKLSSSASLGLLIKSVLPTPSKVYLIPRDCARILKGCI